MKRKILYLLLSTILFLGCMVKNNTYVYADSTEEDAVINSGVYIDEIDVGGLTKEEANTAYTEYINQIGSTTITLKHNDKSIDVKLSDIGISCEDGSTVVDEAFSFGRNGNIIKRYKERKDIQQENVVIDVEKTIDKDVMVEYLTNNQSQLVQLMTNASIQRNGDSFELTKEQVGEKIDYDATYDLITEYINEQLGDGSSIDICVQEDDPAYKESDFANISSTPLGSFTTYFTASATNRNNNIKNATKFINGTVLYPGEEFSTSDCISPITYDNGYSDAGAFSNGEVISSVGGGVCQVSSTLYNAVLRAELDVTERSNHSMTVGYVQLSADAAIAGDWKNFKFVNSTDSPIYIEGYCTSTSVTFNIYGHETRAAGRTVDFKNEVLEVIQPGEEEVTLDSNMPEGTRNVTQEAYTGYRAKLVKYVYQDGKLVSTEDVNTSYYQATPQKVTVGSKPADTTAQPATNPTEAQPADTTETPVTDPTPSDAQVSDPTPTP